MSEKTIQDAANLKDWLITTKGVDPAIAAAASQALFNKGYNLPPTLIGINFEVLTRAGISDPCAQSLRNKLRDQQKIGKLRWCSRIHFCIQRDVRIRKILDGFKCAAASNITSSFYGF
jgi:hypothetical protein